MLVKTEGASRMDNPEALAILNNMDPTKNRR
jgi:hypothetical protein